MDVSGASFEGSKAKQASEPEIPLEPEWHVPWAGLVQQLVVRDMARSACL
jgi:hypothetical protein